VDGILLFKTLTDLKKPSTPYPRIAGSAVPKHFKFGEHLDTQSSNNV